MIHKYYKLFRKPTDPIHLPKNAQYKDYGEKRDIPGVGFPVVGEVYCEGKISDKDCLHFELWEAPK